MDEAGVADGMVTERSGSSSCEVSAEVVASTRVVNGVVEVKGDEDATGSVARLVDLVTGASVAATVEMLAESVEVGQMTTRGTG